MFSLIRIKQSVFGGRTSKIENRTTSTTYGIIHKKGVKIDYGLHNGIVIAKNRKHPALKTFEIDLISRLSYKKALDLVRNLNAEQAKGHHKTRAELASRWRRLHRNRRKKTLQRYLTHPDALSLTPKIVNAVGARRRVFKLALANAADLMKPEQNRNAARIVSAIAATPPAERKRAIARAKQRRKADRHSDIC